MYYIPELLCRRNQGRMSRCWLAATLNENRFKKICKTNELINLNIVLASEEIVNIVIRIPGSPTRFSLYLSSQLVYGLSKILLYKAIALEVFMKNIRNDLRPIDLKKLLEKQEKLEIIQDLPIDLPDPTKLEQRFLKQLEEPDRHLLPDIDYYDGSFSKIQDDEFENREFDRVESNDLTALLRGCLANEAETTDKSREHLKVDNTNADISTYAGELFEVTRQPLIDFHAVNSQDGSEPRTPSKRKGRVSDVHTPSKRHRRNLRDSLENQENVPPRNIPDIDQTYSQWENIENDPPMPSLDASNIQPVGQMYSLFDNAPQPPQIPMNNQANYVPGPSVPAGPPLETTNIGLNLSLEPLVLSEILPRRKKKPLKLNIDQINCISSNDIQAQIRNINIMTRPKDIFNIDRIRFDSQLLFTNPSTFWRGQSIIASSNKLLPLFMLNLNRRFHVDYDESQFPEKIRYRDISEKTVELSSGNSRQQEQTIEPSVRDISDPIANVDKIIPHGEIDHEPLNHLDDTFTFMQPTVGLAAVGDQTCVIPTDDTVRVRDSTKSDTNSSSFLPEHYNESSVHKQNFSMTEKIIDNSSKSSSISPISNELLTENMLYDELVCRWTEKNIPIKFEDLFIPAEVQQVDVASSLLYLLHLAKNGQISLDQSDPYRTIWISLSL